MYYLVCYDIVNDSRRQKVSKLLERYGWRVQKSVFECLVEDKHLERLQNQLLRLINRHSDQIRFYPLSAPCRENVLILGDKPEFAIDDATFIV